MPREVGTPQPKLHELNAFSRRVDDELRDATELAARDAAEAVRVALTGRQGRRTRRARRSGEAE